MHKRPFLPLVLACAALFATVADARPARGAPGDRTLVYRQAGDSKLALDLWYPRDLKAGEKLPVLVFFHGGGWATGHRGQFSRQAALLTSQARIIVASASYPLNRNPLEATDAAQGAVCWLRRQADELGIDSSRLALAGASSGGQMAAAAALLRTSSAPECAGMPATEPAALVLFNPVLDVAGRFRRAGLDVRAVSPVEIVGSHLPPTLILQGTEDRVAPLAGATRFAELARAAGAPPVRVVEYAGRTHGFFNNEAGGDLRLTVDEVTTFLRSLGWKV